MFSQAMLIKSGDVSMKVIRLKEKEKYISFLGSEEAGYHWKFLQALGEGEQFRENTLITLDAPKIFGWM